MSLVLAIVAVGLLVVGVLFLFAAAFGVLRFPDALQRMHASTKAGTVGAIFAVAGAVAAEPSAGRLFIGGVAIGFLLLTVPVAAHLLGRAAYVSGAQLTGVDRNDALRGKLARKGAPLEERTDFEPHDPSSPAAGPGHQA